MRLQYIDRRRRLRRNLRIILSLIVVLVGGVGFAAALIHFNIDLGPFFLINFAAFPVFTYVCIYIHEFGHAFAARIVGISIKRVTIGVGREIMHFKLLGTTVVVTNRFSGGFTQPSKFEGNSLRARFLILTAGGSAFQLIVAGLVLLLFGFRTDRIFLGWGFDLPGAFLVANVFTALYALLPLKIKVLGARMPFDGLKIIMLLTTGQKAIDQMRLHNMLLDASECFERKDYDTAITLFRECTTQYPTEYASRINLAFALMRTLKFDEARHIMSEILEDGRAKDYRALTYNNLAWLDLLSGDPACLAEADKYSKQALEANSKVPMFKGTRACVLIELDKAEDGIKLLNKQVNLKRPIDDKTNNAVGFLFMGYGLMKMGDIAAARSYLQKVNDRYAELNAEERFLFDRILERTNGFKGLFETKNVPLLS